MKKLLVIGTLVLGGAGGFAIVESEILANVKDKSTVITADEAKEIANQIFEGTITEFEYDRDGEMSHYEIEMVGANEKVEVEVNGKTGDVVIVEREAIVESVVSTEAANEAVKNSLNISQEATAVISIDKAKEIALQMAPGTVTEVELEDGLYEIEIANGQYEYDVKIDANTGEILVMDKEFDIFN